MPEWQLESWEKELLSLAYSSKSAGERELAGLLRSMTHARVALVISK
jgi:hypothetical protein